MVDRDQILEDVEKIKLAIENLPTHWDGKEAILALKDADYQWRQMEWIGWYFEFLCEGPLREAGFRIPGEKYGNVEFDSLGVINWDIKSSVIKANNHRVILNDILAIDQSIQEYGTHGVIIALLDAEFNDDDRSFQSWHAELKGGISDYEKDRIQRRATSRYRKTQADLMQVLFLAIDGDNVNDLATHSQGRNSDGSPRKPKYEINIEKADKFEIGRMIY